MIQLDPFPVEIIENNLNIPTGKGLAIGWIDYSIEENLIWVIGLDNRQIWLAPNPIVRMRENLTIGRK